VPYTPQQTVTVEMYDAQWRFRAMDREAYLTVAHLTDDGVTQEQAADAGDLLWEKYLVGWEDVTDPNDPETPLVFSAEAKALIPYNVQSRVTTKLVQEWLAVEAGKGSAPAEPVTA